MNKALYKPPHIGSYAPDDICYLLKELGSEINESSADEREKLIQQGIHYSELLPQEYVPSPKYMELFYYTLDKYKEKVARYTGITAEKILQAKGRNVVLVSLARAGSPVGVLLKRYCKKIHNIDIPHYSISIIRNKGFDKNAITYLLQHYSESQLLFVDGWTGKGAIGKQLSIACSEYNNQFHTSLLPELAVIADPAHSAHIFGTREDLLIPSACLNATVSGLVSRTFHRQDVIGERDFHGARFYKNLMDQDVSNHYVDKIAQYFKQETCNSGIDPDPSGKGWQSILRMKELFDIDDINHIKPGIGETTRVLLRRVPWKILVHSSQTDALDHIYQLARERNVPVEIYNDMEYSCCGLIKEIKTTNDFCQ